MAVLVEEGPLAHTTQLLPLDGRGDLVGEGDLEVQFEQVLQNLRQSLAAGGAGMEDIVRLHLYSKRAEDAATIQRLLADTFSGTHKPAVSQVVTHLPHPKALVAMDAVAASSHDEDEVRVHQASSLAGANRQGHVAIMPQGNKVYLSGQTAPGDMAESTVGVMKSLLATLAYMGLEASDIVQVKAFMHPIADAERVADTVRSFFRAGPAPPFVAVEWHDASYLSYLSLDEQEGPVPIEIEVLASRGPTGGESPDPVTYSTPPWLGQPETYSRIAEMHAGDMVYVSGLYGRGENPRAELESMYQKLSQILDKTGSDFEHLLKGTYYVTSAEASEALNQIRTEYYPAFEAPTSSKMPVRATGQPNTTVTFDMIGGVPR